MIKLLTSTTLLLGLCSNAFAGSKADVVLSIRAVASEFNIDPDVAVAIATVESGLNPKAVGALGEIGLFQLRPEYHNVIAGRTDHNTRVALNYLSELQTKWAPVYGDAWFVLFNWGPNNPPKNPRETKYYRKVMREVGQIKFRRYLAAYN